MVQYFPEVTGSLTINGSLSVSGPMSITGSIAGTSSLASNALLLSGTGSFTATSSSLSSRTTQIESIYATTGSNSFRATQSITGSLTVTGQIIAQTLNVQQVTSSIVYSSGSNVFGCDINSRQTFTGSFYQTGSVAYFAGCLGAGTVTGNGYRLEAVNPSSPSSATNLFYGLHSGNNTLTIKQFGASHPTSPYVNQIGVLNAEQHLHLVTDTQACIDAGTSTKGIFLKCGGNVGIGTQSPDRLLTINGDSTLLGNNYISTNKFLQWEGGAYWTARTTSTGNNFEIYRGDTGASPLVISNCNKIGIGATSPRWLLEICANNACGGAGHYPAISINNVCCTGYSAYYFYKGADQMGGLEMSNGTGHLLINTPTTFAVQTSGTNRLLISGGNACFAVDSYFCGSTYGIMGLGCKVFDKVCYIMTTTGTICLPLDGLGYGSGPTRAIYIYGTLLGNDSLQYAHLVYFYRNDYGGLMQANIAQASCVFPSTAGQAYTFSVNDPVGLGKSNCTLNLRLTSSGAGVAAGSYCTQMRIVVYNIPG